MPDEAPSEEFPIPARLNLCIAAGQLAAILLIFYGASLATTPLQIFGLALAFAVVGNSVYSIIHEAEHRMLHPNQRVNVDRKEVVSMALSKVSPMPTNLLSPLTRDEILDLLAYLVSGGDPQHAVFQP